MINKKIPSVLGLGIVLIIAIVFGGIFWTDRNNEQNNEMVLENNKADEINITESEKNNTVNKSFIYGEKTRMILAFEDKGENATIKEYIPESETLDNYNLLFAIRTNHFASNPKEYRDEMVNSLKNTAKDSKIALADKEASGEYFVYFTLADPNNKFVEHNAFKYMKDMSGEGIIYYQLVLRDYMEDRISSLNIAEDSKKHFTRLEEMIRYSGLNPQEQS